MLRAARSLALVRTVVATVVAAATAAAIAAAAIAAAAFTAAAFTAAATAAALFQLVECSERYVLGRQRRRGLSGSAGVAWVWCCDAQSQGSRLLCWAMRLLFRGLRLWQSGRGGGSTDR